MLSQKETVKRLRFSDEQYSAPILAVKKAKVDSSVVNLVDWLVSNQSFLQNPEAEIRTQCLRGCDLALHLITVFLQNPPVQPQLFASWIENNFEKHFIKNPTLHLQLTYVSARNFVIMFARQNQNNLHWVSQHKHYAKVAMQDNDVSWMLDLPDQLMIEELTHPANTEQVVRLNAKMQIIINKMSNLEGDYQIHLDSMLAELPLYSRFLTGIINNQDFIGLFADYADYNAAAQTYLTQLFVALKQLKKHSKEQNIVDVVKRIRNAKSVNLEDVLVAGYLSGRLNMLRALSAEDDGYYIILQAMVFQERFRTVISEYFQQDNQFVIWLGSQDAETQALVSAFFEKLDFELAKPVMIDLTRIWYATSGLIGHEKTMSEITLRDLSAAEIKLYRSAFPSAKQAYLDAIKDAELSQDHSAGLNVGQDVLLWLMCAHNNHRGLVAHINAFSEQLTGVFLRYIEHKQQQALIAEKPTSPKRPFFDVVNSPVKREKKTVEDISPSLTLK